MVMALHNKQSVALTSGHVGETPAVNHGRVKWTHGSHAPDEAAVLEMFFTNAVSVT